MLVHVLTCTCMCWVSLEQKNKVVLIAVGTKIVSVWEAHNDRSFIHYILWNYNNIV